MNGTTHVSLDATALLALQLDVPARAVTVAALERSPIWSASALALGEATAGAARLAGGLDGTGGDALASLLEDGIRRTWDFLHVVPVDQRCIDLAADLAARQPVKISTAVHLVAARRIAPAGVYVTFDPAHIPLALSLGLEVVSG